MVEAASDASAARRSSGMPNWRARWSKRLLSKAPSPFWAQRSDAVHPAHETQRPRRGAPGQAGTSAKRKAQSLVSRVEDDTNLNGKLT